MATTLDKYGYRKYLNEKGFNDNDITYDNGTVNLKGQFFGNATPEADGSTYSTKGNLDALYNNYRTQNMPNTPTNQERSNDLYNQALQKINQQRTPFQYNPQTDPMYQSALQAAQQGAATQQGNTLARLRAMGQGKSSYSEGVANQIGQQAVSNVNANVLPQLMSQAYNRYLDEQNMGRQNALDLMGLGREYNNLNQQGLDNEYRNRTFDRNVLENDRTFARGVLENDRAFDRGVLESDRSFDRQQQQDQLAQKNLEEEKAYRQQRDSVEDQRWLANYERQGQEFAAQQGLQWANLNQRQREFVADQAWKEKDFGLKQQEIEASTNPNSLENRYKEAQIKNIESQVKDRGTESTGIDEYDLLTVNSLAKQAGINPQTAKPEEIKSFVANLKGQHGWSLDEAKQVESYLNDQRAAYEQQVADKKASEKPKPFGYRMLGG